MPTTVDWRKDKKKVAAVGVSTDRSKRSVCKH